MVQRIQKKMVRNLLSRVARVIVFLTTAVTIVVIKEKYKEKEMRDKILALLVVTFMTGYGFYEIIKDANCTISLIGGYVVLAMGIVADSIILSHRVNKEN